MSSEFSVHLAGRNLGQPAYGRRGLESAGDAYTHDGGLRFASASLPCSLFVIAPKLCSRPAFLENGFGHVKKRRHLADPAFRKSRDESPSGNLADCSSVTGYSELLDDAQIPIGQLFVVVGSGVQLGRDGLLSTPRQAAIRREEHPRDDATRSWSSSSTVPPAYPKVQTFSLE